MRTQYTIPATAEADLSKAVADLSRIQRLTIYLQKDGKESTPPEAVGAEIFISGKEVLAMIHKALGNRTNKSKDGPITVTIYRPRKAKEVKS